MEVTCYIHVFPITELRHMFPQNYMYTDMKQLTVASQVSIKFTKCLHTTYMYVAELEKHLNISRTEIR